MRARRFLLVILLVLCTNALGCRAGFKSLASKLFSKDGRARVSNQLVQEIIEHSLAPLLGFGSPGAAVSQSNPTMQRADVRHHMHGAPITNGSRNVR